MDVISNPRPWHAALCLGMTLLCACGGGGGRDAGSQATSTRGEAPLAAFGSGGSAAGAVPFNASFDGSGSADPDGSITSYSWSFGDGQTGAGATASHQFDADQTYTVTLTVTDDQMNTASARSLIAASGDPLLALQWHLDNRGQSGGLAGADVGAQAVWAGCGDSPDCRGEGVRIAVVDDGLELGHEDLAANIVAGASHDYLSGGSDPSPAGLAPHGTAVAGIAAARDGNGLGGRGVAPRAELVGYNLLQSPTLGNQADAMTRDADQVAVSINSWGAPDGSGNLQPSDLSWRDAVEFGLRSGRGGKGVFYVWAAGNGDRRAVTQSGQSLPVDNSNYDGQANFHGVTAVAALDDDGRKTSYSEPGANLWVSAPGGESCGSGDAIVSTDQSGGRGLNPGSGGGADLDYGNYTRCMNGTSAAAPMVAGVAVLVLQARPELSWRDLKAILARSARRTDAASAGWETNGAGLAIHPDYGFGAVDAAAAVALAGSWAPLPAALEYASETHAPALPIPDGDPAGVSDEIVVSGSGIARIEFVDIYFSAADHSYPGDLEITLSNEITGTRSVLAQTHLCDCRGAGQAHADWRFGSARHLDEAADGRWRLTVRDRLGEDVGSFQSWRLVFHGH